MPLMSFSRKIAVLIFLASFAFSSVFLGLRWSMFGIIDGSLWAQQAEYVVTENDTQYDFLQGYGHPGGPLIEGTIALKTIFGIPYSLAMIVIVTVYMSMFIAGACVVAYILSPRSFWWPMMLGMLSLSWLYSFVTPPSAVSATSIAFLSIFTLLLYQRGSIVRTRHIILWGIASGFSIATRFDMGVFFSFWYALLLWRAIGLRFMIAAIPTSLAVLYVADPYFWYMPVQHAKDLVYKITYHYAEYEPTRMSLTRIFSISSIAVIGVVYTVIGLLFSKRIGSPLPRLFSVTLLLMSVILYSVFLTAHYQSERYFIPLLFVWEMFLTYYLCFLAEKIKFSGVSITQDAVRKQSMIEFFIIGMVFSTQFLLFWFVAAI